MKIGIISSRLLMRRALRTLLQSLGDFEVTLEADSPDLNGRHPTLSGTDVLLVDVDPPAGDVALLSRIREQLAGPKLLLLTETSGEDFELLSLKAGCHGCVSFRSRPELVERILRTVGRGEVWVSRQAASHLVRQFISPEKENEGEPEKLTRREWEILGLIADGYRNKEIASRLFVSEHTIKTHLCNIYMKLHVTTRIGAALYFFHHTSREPSREDSLLYAKSA